MKLNSNSWHAKLYLFAYHNKARTTCFDGCEYIRKIIFAIITLPFYFIGGIIYHVRGHNALNFEFATYADSFLLQTVITLLLIITLVMGASFNTSVLGIDDQIGLLCYLGMALVSGVGLLCVPLLIVSLSVFTISYFTDRKYNNPKKKSDGFVKKAYKAIKDKYCPIIEWENEK